MKVAILFFVVVLFAVVIISRAQQNGEFLIKNSSCLLKHAKNNVKSLDIYWINLDSSFDRKIMMQQYLQYYGLSNNFRVKAVNPAHIIIPAEISRPPKCQSITKNQTLELLREIRQQRQESSKGQNHQKQSFNRTILLSSHCGRPKNSLKELAVTLSHVFTLHKALHSHRTHSQEYILVFEDDLQLAIEIDFSELIRQAPKDFIILQLVTSNFYVIQHLWKLYLRKNQLFVKRKENDDYWCAGAYLIHKARFQRLFSSQIFQKKRDNLYLANIIAGYHRPNCVPHFCCNESTSTFLSNYQVDTVCIKSARGYQADNYIFALASEHTYLLTIPLFVNSKVGHSSTLHQDHVGIHHLAFNQTKEIIKDLFINGKYSREKIPSFANRYCTLNFSTETLS